MNTTQKQLLSYETDQKSDSLEVLRRFPMIPLKVLTPKFTHLGQKDKEEFLLKSKYRSLTSQTRKRLHEKNNAEKMRQFSIDAQKVIYVEGINHDNLKELFTNFPDWQAYLFIFDLLKKCLLPKRRAKRKIP